MSGTSTTTSGGVAAPKVKALQTQTGKGGSQTSSTTSTCKFWGSESGCKYGKQCKFAHRSQVQKVRSVAGSAQQQLIGRWIAPTRTMTVLDNSQKLWLGGVLMVVVRAKGRSRSTSSTRMATVAIAKVMENHNMMRVLRVRMALQSTRPQPHEAAIRGDGPPQKQQQDGGTGDAAAAADGLMTEVTSLLKSLRVATQRGPQIRAYRLKSAEVQGEGRSVGRMLLDGGATHCLRQPNSNKEWEESVPVQVQLASGQVEDSSQEQQPFDVPTGSEHHTLEQDH